jgi:hypothetical protein
MTECACKEVRQKGMAATTVCLQLLRLDEDREALKRKYEYLSPAPGTESTDFA